MVSYYLFYAPFVFVVSNSIIFLQSLLNTSIGQHLDYTMAHRNKNDYSLFTIDRYNAIVKYKTAYYTYKLTVCLGFYLANKTSKELHALAEDIALEIGQFFQIQVSPRPHPLI